MSGNCSCAPVPKIKLKIKKKKKDFQNVTDLFPMKTEERYHSHNDFKILHVLHLRKAH